MILHSSFELPQTEAQELLNLVNYGETPNHLTLLNLDIIKTAEDYVSLELAVTRDCLFYAMEQLNAAGYPIIFDIHDGWCWKYRRTLPILPRLWRLCPDPSRRRPDCR